MTAAFNCNVPAVPVLKCRRVSGSRNADKFILNSSAEAVLALDEIAAHNSRSMNSEFIIAFTEALEGGDKAELSRDLYVAQLGVARASSVLLKVGHVDLPMMSGENRSAIRLPPGVRAKITETARNEKVSMATWMLKAMFWWINLQRDTHALLTACVAIRKEVTPSASDQWGTFTKLSSITPPQSHGADRPQATTARMAPPLRPEVSQ